MHEKSEVSDNCYSIRVNRPKWFIFHDQGLEEEKNGKIVISYLICMLIVEQNQTWVLNTGLQNIDRNLNSIYFHFFRRKRKLIVRSNNNNRFRRLRLFTYLFIHLLFSRYCFASMKICVARLDCTSWLHIKYSNP